jgi:hypothetical protein
MFPCEMARYIAGFPREARKYGQFLTPRQRANTAPHRSGCRVIEDEDERPARPPSGPDRTGFQHFGLFAGHFLAGAGFGGAGLGGGGGAGRGGGGGGRAAGAGRGGGAACRGGGGGGGAARRAGSALGFGGGGGGGTGFEAAIAGFDGGGGGGSLFRVGSWTGSFCVGVEAALPAFGFSTSGADGLVPDVFALPPAAGLAVPVAGDVGGVVVSLFSGAGFRPGFAAPDAGSLMPAGGKEAPPFMPGSVLSLGSVFGAVFVCKVPGAPFWPDGAPAVSGLAVEFSKALGGTGCSPFLIAVALFVTDSGACTCAPVLAVVTPPCPGPPLATLGAPVAPAGATAGGRLMTLLMTVVLWMLAKMMLFGGGLTYTGGRT